MAAALLMMNMQGAVMAADKDQTIFRYSDKVPFALIINPNNHATCREVWETLWNKFRLMDIKEEIYSISFINYLKDALPKYQKLPSDFSNETFFLVWYQTGHIFPEAKAYQLTIDNAKITVNETDEASEISTGHPYSVYRIGSFDHMNRLFDGDISDKEKVIQEKVSSFIEDFNPQNISPINKLLVSIKLEDIKPQIQSLIQKYKQKRMDGIAKAICSSHIEDMIRMAENVIDAEGQQHKLQHPEEALESTKEIATMTLAEGFRWIKHSLYGAV